MKVVINRSVGFRFSMSPTGFNRLVELKGPIGDDKRPLEQSNFLHNLPRNDKDLVQVVEELGMAASADDAELTVVEIPDTAKWSISDVVGFEYVKVNGNIF